MTAATKKPRFRPEKCKSLHDLVGRTVEITIHVRGTGPDRFGLDAHLTLTARVRYVPSNVGYAAFWIGPMCIAEHANHDLRYDPDADEFTLTLR